MAWSVATFAWLAACAAPPAPVQISQSGKGAFEASLAVHVSGFTVAWYDTRDGNGEIYVRALDAAGHPYGPERRLTNSPADSYEASLEHLGTDIVVAWYEQAGGERTAMLGAWDRDGRQQWARSFPQGSRNPVVRTDGSHIFCAWIQGGDVEGEAVWAGWWDGAGGERRAPVRLGPASTNSWNLNAALDASGGAWVVFDAATSTRSSELFLAGLDGDRTSLTRLTRDDGIPSKYPDLAIASDGRAALTWYDERDGNAEVYLLVGPLGRLTGEIDAVARRVTTSPGESIGAYVAWNGDRLGLAWSDRGGDPSGQHEVYLQSFRGAEPEGNPVRVTRTDAWSLVPSVRPWGDGFALAWNEYVPAAGPVHAGTAEVSFVVVP